MDGLTAFFLGDARARRGAGACVLRCVPAADGRGRAIAALTAVFVLVLAAVLCARDPLSFLLGWELMTLLPAAVILVAHGATRASRHVVFTYVAITHLGGVGTWVAVLLLAQRGAFGGASPSRPARRCRSRSRSRALVGMGTKAGVMPLHVWLPRAHPVAPAPVSALMSGVMIKVAIYGLVRVLVDWIGVAARLARRAGARRWARCRPSAASSTRCSSTT